MLLVGSEYVEIKSATPQNYELCKSRHKISGYKTPTPQSTAVKLQAWLLAYYHLHQGTHRTGSTSPMIPSHLKTLNTDTHSTLHQLCGADLEN